jgi:hypothetical protein
METRKRIYAPIVKTTIALLLVVVLMLLFSRGTKVTFLDEGLKIHGLYGGAYNWELMEEVNLMESLPKIERRTNGAAVGSHLTGYFKTTEYGSVKLFVNTKKPPFVFIKNNGHIVIFNLNDADKTIAAYEEILGRVEGLRD